jgi:hypothetical protein
MVRHHAHHERTSNDQKSDVHNPTSKEHQDILDNRSRQIQENSESEE